MTLVIIAAGMGSRYGGMKQIDPITENGEFIIDFTVFDAIAAGFDRVVIVVKEENLELFKSTVGARIERHVKVEYVFHVIKGIFGFRKTRYRGLAKLKTHLDILCASANFFMLATARKAERIQKSKTALLFEAQFQG